MAPSPANLWVLLGLGIAGIVLLTKKLRKAAREDFGAFVGRLNLLPPPPPPPPKAPHPLAGLSFAVADMFDVEGSVTGFGNPDWARTHQPALGTASSVLTVVEGGASCVGKTVIDEMGLGIHGGNKHHEAPINPAAPARISGGSCSGSSVAVAASIVDFSLGIDTTGGVRIPAACCGILGFRPTHGAISRAGVLPVSPSLDVVGWCSKDPNVLKSIGQVLLKFPVTADSRPRQVIFADDCFQLLRIPKSRVAQVVLKSVEKLFGRQNLRNAVLEDFLSSKVPSLKYFASSNRNGELNSPLRQLAYAMQSLQRHEFKVNHHEWVASTKPDLDTLTLDMMRSANDPVVETLSNCQAVRSEMQSALNTLLKNDGVLVIPTLYDLPPKLGSRKAFSEEHRIHVFSISAIASMSGCCEVTIPLGHHDKCPVSVSFIARQGGDCFLLHLAKSIFTTLQQEAEIISKSSLTTDIIIGKEMAAETAKEKGNIAYKEKQWQKAVGFYTDAIKLNGKIATYYSNRAAAYLEMDSFLQAEADCSAAINLDKKNVKAYLRRGTAREMLSYYNEAIEDFKYALILEPTNKTATLALNRLKQLF